MNHVSLNFITLNHSILFDVWLRTALRENSLLLLLIWFLWKCSNSFVLMNVLKKKLYIKNKIIKIF